LRTNAQLMGRFSLTAETKYRYLSIVLGILALSTNFLLRTIEGLTLALALSSISLFLFLYQWSPSKHLLKTKLNGEDFFFAATSVILYSYLNIATKVLVPIAIAISFTVALETIAVLLGGAFGAYALFLYVDRMTHHHDFIENIDSFRDARLQEQYERLGNSVVVASTFLAIDAPDLMLILLAIVTSSKLLVSAVLLGSSKLGKIIPVFGSRSRPIGRQLQRFSRSIETLDLEEAIWKRVLYIIQYKRGFSYLLLALISGFPAIVYSYSIDFLMPESGKFAIFLLLAFPSLVIVYALRLPRGLVSTAKEAGRLRKILFILSMVAPLITIPIVYIDPYLLGYGGKANFSDIEVIGNFFAFIWLAILPFVIALPLYFMVASVEFEDYQSFIRGAKLFAMLPSLATSLMSITAVIVSNFSFSVSLIIFALYVSCACYFYPFVVYVTIKILKHVERRTDKSMQEWIDRIRGPSWSAELLAVALGSIFFPLWIFIGSPYPWVVPRQGLLFPHLLPILFWIVGGATVMLIVSQVSQARRLLGSVRIGVVGSLGVTSQAILFIGLPYSVTTWAPWVTLIPISFTFGAMIPVIMRRLLYGE